VSARLRAVHPALATSDVATSVVFYERLGFREIFRDDARAPRYGSREFHLRDPDGNGLRSCRPR